ncbi:hypothetical protein SAMN02746066_03252 [Anaerosporobacter mobilis DSM 15930]|uniref:DNA binding domain-containing protein, excisionase family n=1 Tax=Anaerosporobacter mobilis DSM 15930 TaxID=1120996 RepID=A0A1M7LGR5_9FIRM|nr:hypothetical protein [Anaerosporobacter mobilis]SHM77177.1 hypothetical protein SAMN02746066_03252 [Anaerosporobacter mobilis DSM 15930]
MDELVTIPTISKILGCNQHMVGKLMDAELIQPLKFGNCRKARRRAVDEFMINYEGFDLSDPFNVVPITQAAIEKELRKKIKEVAV